MGDRRSFLQALLPREERIMTPREAFSRMPRLETPRLLLRPMTMHDAQDIYDYSRDPEVARYVLWSAHRSLSESRAYLRYIIRQYREGMPSSWGIVLKATGHLVGTIGYMAYSEENSTVEIGYSLARHLWNHGLMTEALYAVLAFSFERMQIHRVEAQHDAANPASGQVMRKCGMQHEGRLRGRVYNKGRFVDVELYAMVREDWLRSHAAPR